MPPQEQDPMNPAPQQPVTPPQAPQQPMPSFPPQQPQNPQLSPNPSQPPTQQPMMQPLPSASTGNKKLLFIIVGAVVAALLIIIVGAALLMSKSKSSDSQQNTGTSSSLETYSNDNYSLLIPKGYTKQKESSTSIEFAESGAADQASKVLVSYQKHSRTLSSTEVTSARQTLKTRFQDFGKTTSDALGDVQDVKVVETTFKNQPALKLTAAITKNGAKAGNITIIAVLTDKELHMIGVAAHAGDPQILKETDEIINSFTLKQPS